MGGMRQPVSSAAINLNPGNAAYYRMRVNLRNMLADSDGALAK
jgi:hypothetical protein